MQDGSVALGPYSSPPSSDDEGITNAIREGQPEKIFGLAWSKPNFSVKDHKIVRAFDIDRKKRPGLECIPCAICSGDHPKFLDGAVLWSPDGWLRLIGHTCAAKPEHFGEAQYRKLRKQREQEELDAVALNWLQANIAAIRPLIDVIRKMKACAVAWERHGQTLYRQVPELGRLLEDAIKQHGGQLTVVQYLSETRLAAAYSNENGKAAQSRYEQINLGALRGQSLLFRPRHARQKWGRQLDSIIEAFDKIPVGNGKEPLLTLIAQGGEQAVTIAAGMAFRAVQNALELAEKIGDAEQFVSDENLTLLENWGADIRNTLRFTVHKAPVLVTFTLADRSRVSIPLMFPKLPDLSPLKALADAGLQLDKLLPKRSVRDTESQISTAAA